MTIRDCMRRSLRLALVLAACDAAGDGDDELDPRLHEEIGDGMSSLSCGELVARVDELIAETMRCAEDQACEPVSGAAVLPDACLPQLKCYVPFARDAELASFRIELALLDEAYARACVCPIAACADPYRVFSTCERGSCEIGVAAPVQDLAAPR